ncbi:MAG: hypothetical protein U5S82_07415 [Gammaproteobacteria bacterium]|nr:hypothetical protein [Gammaproteobacteria bacterium]
MRGQVARVVDGDTRHLAESLQARSVKLRLADIDTSERDQPYGRDATQLLARLAFGRSLCATTTVDRGAISRWRRME